MKVVTDATKLAIEQLQSHQAVVRHEKTKADVAKDARGKQRKPEEATSEVRASVMMYF